MNTNKLLLILNGLVFILVIALFVYVLSGKRSETNTIRTFSNDSTMLAQLPIAYVNIDSLLLNYEFAKKSNETLMKKQEDSRLTLNTKAKQLQGEMAEFQRKIDAQAFLSRERAENAHNDILKKQQNLQAVEAKLSQEILDAQQKVSEQLRDTIDNFLKEYNKDHKYQIILCNTANDNVLFANKQYDITSEVVDILNKRFNK